MYDNDELKERRQKRVEEKEKPSVVEVMDQTAKGLGLTTVIVVGLTEAGEVRTHSPNNLPPPLVVGFLEFAKASILMRHMQKPSGGEVA